MSLDIEGAVKVLPWLPFKTHQRKLKFEQLCELVNFEVFGGNKFLFALPALAFSNNVKILVDHFFAASAWNMKIH